MSFALTRIAAMPDTFNDLRGMAEHEGYGFVRRLGERWDGKQYVDDQLATVWGATIGDALIAIGAQTYDEYDPSPLHRRIRHFYVRPDWRRGGVGRSVAEKLIADAHAIAPLLHLRATHALSMAFWDGVGSHVWPDARIGPMCWHGPRRGLLQTRALSTTAHRTSS